jgi:hypothetical protein
MLSRLWVAVLLFVLLAGAASARDVQLVLAQTKAAVGGAVLDGVKAIRITYRLRQNGLEGTGVTLTDVVTGREVTRFRLGPLTGAEGFDGRRYWTQDAAGLVTVPEGGDRRPQSVSAQYRQALGYWYPARVARAQVNLRIQLFRMRIKEALEIAPEGGLPFEVWFDAQTKLLDRVVEVGATETRTTSYEDYRPVGGLTIAHRIRSSNAAAAFGAERTVGKVEINPKFDEADFAVPPEPAPDYVFSGRERRVTVPFRFVNNHIYVDAKLNGRVFPLLVDTGAANVITPTATRALKLPSVGEGRVRGAGDDTEPVAFTRVSVLALGGVKLRNQLFSVVPLEKMGDIEGMPFHGLIGYELFKRLVVRIDYEARTLTLIEAKSFVPEVEGVIGGVAASFDVDTGSRASVGLNAPFVQGHALRALFRPSIEAVTGWGLGGPTYGTVARAKRLSIGAVRIDNVVVDMSLQRSGSTANAAPSGAIGSGLLKRFVVTFDYPHQRIYFARHARSGEADRFDRSGLWINRDSVGYRIDGVVAGSPAAEAGLHVGDIVLEVDGAAAHSISLGDLRDRLRDGAPGSEVRFKVRSGGRVRDVSIRLRELI